MHVTNHSMRCLERQDKATQQRKIGLLRWDSNPRHSHSRRCSYQLSYQGSSAGWAKSHIYTNQDRVLQLTSSSIYQESRSLSPGIWRRRSFNNRAKLRALKQTQHMYIYIYIYIYLLPSHIAQQCIISYSALGNIFPYCPVILPSQF